MRFFLSFFDFFLMKEPHSSPDFSPASSPGVFIGNGSRTVSKRGVTSFSVLFNKASVGIERPEEFRRSEAGSTEAETPDGSSESALDELFLFFLSFFDRLLVKAKSPNKLSGASVAPSEVFVSSSRMETSRLVGPELYRPVSEALV